MRRAVAPLTTALVLSAPCLAGGLLPADANAGTQCRVADTTARPRPHFNAGTRRIAVGLPPRATFVAVPPGKPGWAFAQPDGWIRAKVGWWTAEGAPRIAGRRLDGRARPLRADVAPLSWTASGQGFYPTILYFPSTGCWRLTAAAGGSSVDLVVRVVRA